MRKLKIIHIDSEKQWGGGQRQVTGLCAYLKDQGHEVKLICKPGSKLEEWASNAGFEAFPIKMTPGNPLPSIARLASVLRREKPDVVHLHASRAHVFGSAASRLAGIRVVIATRRMEDRIHMTWPNTSAYGSWTTALVAISGAVRDVMVDCGADAAKIRVIESGTDLNRFEQAVPDKNWRESHGINGSTPLVCAAATMARGKGLQYLIEAANILKNRGIPVHLVLAGDGDHRGELEELTRSMGVGATFTKFCSDMPALLANMDIFAMPSLAEGLGVAALEAMAAAKPVVASAVGGLKESVIDGTTGFLVPPADSAALADAIARLIADPKMAAQFGSAGRARVREKYSLEIMAKRNEALYFELLNS